jgi:hypothetical protein
MEQKAVIFELCFKLLKIISFFKTLREAIEHFD